VLIIGRRNAGKTTILEKMTGSEVGAKPVIHGKEGRLVDDPTLVKAGVEVCRADRHFDLFPHPTNKNSSVG
jgi:hypothetical protein